MIFHQQMLTRLWKVEHEANQLKEMLMKDLSAYMQVITEKGVLSGVVLCPGLILLLVVIRLKNQRWINLYLP